MGSLHCLELGPYEAYKHLHVLQLNESLGACLADMGSAVNKQPKHMDCARLAYGQGRQAQALCKSCGAQSIQVHCKILSRSLQAFLISSFENEEGTADVIAVMK